MCFHFTIRELLLVTAIVALAVGWWIDRRNLATKCDEFSQKAATNQKLASLQTELGDLQLQNQKIRQEYNGTDGSMRPFPPELVARRRELNNTRLKNDKRIGQIEKEIEAMTPK